MSGLFGSLGAHTELGLYICALCSKGIISAYFYHIQKCRCFGNAHLITSNHIYHA